MNTEFEAIAWRCRDYADGWIKFDTAEAAWTYAQETDALIQVTYRKLKKEYPSITCPKCGLTSYNANDIKHRFCGRCGYHDDLK